MRRAAAVLLGLLLAGPAAAQEAAPGPPAVAAPPGAEDAGARLAVVVLDREALYARSAYGRRIRAEIEAASGELGAENRRIEQELEEEERALTEWRAELPRAEFEALADTFDRRVEEIRREQDAKGRAIAQRSDRAQALFYERANPLLISLAREIGALVILDRRTVIASADGVDITQRALERIDAVLGDGADLDPGPVPRPDLPARAPDPEGGLSEGVNPAGDGR
jgi:Skp family chaperone for outer membrane proteins